MVARSGGTRFAARQSWEFLADIDVDCPRCAGAARIILQDDADDRDAVLFGPRRLTCAHCGLSRHQGRVTLSDPAMGCVLRLRARTRWGELVFYNRDHLHYVAGYIAAENRQVAFREGGPRNNTVLSRLPRWVKLASNRQDLLAAIGRL
jgi:hypothetical protein